MSKIKIAIIGAGNMGGAIARAAYAENPRPALTVANHTTPKLDELREECPEIVTTTDNHAAAKEADIVVLAVKPWVLPTVIDEIMPALDPERQCLVSVAGGVSLDDLDSMLGAELRDIATCHVIPDTAIAVGRGMTFVSARRCRKQQREAVAALFAAAGEVAEIDESMMGAATALSSCGIAYVFKYMQASVQAGVELGFRPADALRYTVATVAGAAEIMARDSAATPQGEIDKVTTPGGMTIRGINALERAGFTAAVIDGILAPLTPKR